MIDAQELSKPNPRIAEPRSDRSPLTRLASIAAGVGAKRLEANIQAFRQRLDEGHFFVACVGEFKRGKSTLLNALLGQSVLPTGMIPVTTVPTIVQYGSTPAARIRYARGECAAISLSDVEVYVSEAKNPRNALGVEAVEIFLPHPLLRKGLCLVDTPGIGSVFQENSAATRAFVPQIDAALVVIGADPPISGDELGLITAAAKQVQHLIIVLNKADRFTEAEREETRRFAQSVLAPVLGSGAGQILEVSATERLADTGPDRDWDRLFEMLYALAAWSGHAIMHAAFQRGVIRFAEQCLRAIRELNMALFRPVDESDQRIEELRILVGHLAHESLLIGFRMEHAQEELDRDASVRRREYLHHAVPNAQEELAESIAGVAVRFGPTLRMSAFRLANAVARRRLAPWLSAERGNAEARYEETIGRFVEEARMLLASSPKLAELGVGDLAGELDPVESIRVPSSLDAELPRLPMAEPVSHMRWWLDVFGPPHWVRRTIADDATHYLEALLTTGARAVDDDLDRRLGQSEQRIKNSVRAALESVYEAADRGVERARALRAEGADAFQREVERMAALRREVKAVLSAARGEEPHHDASSAGR